MPEDGHGIVSIGLTAFAAHAVRGNKFGWPSGARYFGSHQCRFARLVDANGCEDLDLTLSGELMKSLTFPSWYGVAVDSNLCRLRLAWDGEVPFIL